MKKAVIKKASVVKAEATKVETKTAEVKARPAGKFQSVRKTADGREQYFCQYCNKWIFKDDNVEEGSGALCRHLRDMGLDDAALDAHRAKFTRDEKTIPAGWTLKVSVLHKICEKHNIPVSKMVAAIGWDRGLAEPIDPRFQPYYLGRNRMLNEWCASPEGLKMIAACNRKKPEILAVKSSKPSASAPAPEKPVEALEDALAEAVIAEAEAV